MAQTVVPTYYSTRKRFKDPVKSKDIVKDKLSEVVKDPETTVIADLKKPVQKTLKVKTKGKKINKITNYLKSDPGTSKAIPEKKVSEKCELPRTPKRNLTPEELTPSKKKLISHESGNTPVKQDSPSKLKSSSSVVTPKKQNSVARKKLLLASPVRYGSPKKCGSPFKQELTPQKAAAYENLSNKDLASLVNESRSKILFSGKLDELQKSLKSFSTAHTNTEKFQANSCKITSVVSSAKSSAKESPSIIKGEPGYKKYQFSKAESTLVLPYKYKQLAETFHCLETVVQMLNNRKEKITFEKVKNGVQNMTKVKFSLDHLGQIMTVFPAAYSLQYEKFDSYITNKFSSPYQLVITPNLAEVDGNLSGISSKGKKKNSQNVFIYMTPQHFLERTNIFELNLTKITKKHHQDFLKGKHFPSVSDEKITRWHPEFPVDSVPNIPIAALPEEPKVKVLKAQDVLNKIKGTVRGRVEKALQSVADDHKSESISPPESDVKKSVQNKKQNSALKGICSDLLEKIRARESAKIIETMTRSAQDEKRLAMKERIPKIVHILWHYFIAERKAAVPVDVAVDKIIHSLNSLTTPDAVKEHLELIRETMPGWLSFIRLSRGEYLTIDKKLDISVMLDNIK